MTISAYQSKNFDYNGHIIRQREDRCINALEMCAANEKRLGDWICLKKTKAYLNKLSVAVRIPVAELAKIRNGDQIWVHPSLAINLAQWISPGFAIWCDVEIFHQIEDTRLFTISKRQIRRNRFRVEQQLDAIALKKIDQSFSLSCETWGGKVCPDCCKNVPARFLMPCSNISVPGSHVSWGASCASDRCVRNDDRYPINHEYKRMM